MRIRLSIASREAIKLAITGIPRPVSDIAQITGLSPDSIRTWLQLSRKMDGDFHVCDWEHVYGTACGLAVWLAGPGQDVPFPDREFKRLRKQQLAAIERAQEAARPRAPRFLRPQRDPTVAALFGPYSGHTNHGASA
ncbi:hypothetical protein GCM10007242_44350 [Pigmentiphaga litoralis]|uniref:hypothetical protein n=1 Tax=Pigmentiphaga litoralis TaxID=516702 RepID=UPI001677EE00|nr:hypothetical protein [Pigmentiphaga litoralis]GGX32558.1 hypothetical protein GCM10007242_44350 [Pigmentiphaga litoralis]